MRRIYIIGNGFDLKHNLPSRYSDFAEFCQTNDRVLYEQINLLFPKITQDSLWSNFEEGLGEVDEDKLFKDFYLNDRRNIKDDKFLNLHNSLKLAFAEWISRFERLTSKLEKRFVFDRDDCFISFNYTDVLESLYHIKASQILHIHGYASPEKNALFTGYIFGHSKPNEDPNGDIESFDYLLKDLINGLKKDYQIKGLESQIKKWCTDSKDTDAIKIIVLGHSLNEVDDIYFKAILEIIPNTSWHIGYYDSIDFIQKMKNVVRIFDSKQPVDFFRY